MKLDHPRRIEARERCANPASDASGRSGSTRPSGSDVMPETSESPETESPEAVRTVAGSGGRIERIEPPSWWVGMQTPLQLLVKGQGIASWQVEVAACEGVRVAALHPGSSPDYLFGDVAIAPTARPGRIRLCVSRGGGSAGGGVLAGGRRGGARGGGGGAGGRNAGGR